MDNSKIIKYLFAILFVSISIYLFYYTYTVIKDIKAKKNIELQIQEQVKQSRYNYMKSILEEKKILAQHNQYVEEEARIRFNLSHSNEIIIVFPDNNQNIHEVQISDSSNNKLTNLYEWLNLLGGNSL